MSQLSQKPPFFSILSVTLNNLGGLCGTKKSIIAQNFTDFEWLVQDGGSKDGSIAHLDDHDVAYESAPDNGIYDAMNRLIERSTGRYLLFLNAGDRFASAQILQEIHDAIGMTNPDFIYGGSFENIGPSMGRCKNAKSYKTITRGMFTHHQAMLYARDVVGDLRYDTQYEIAADYDFTARILARTSNILYIPKPVCIFEAGGISQQKTAQGRQEQYKIRKNLGLCGTGVNYMITTAQAINQGFRRVFPGAYWFLKRL